jgi:hypothetical protein
MDDALLKVLQERTSTGEPFDEWHLEADSLTTRLKATTGVLLTDPDEAWEAAKNLRDSIVELGHELYGSCRVGVISDYRLGETTDHHADMPITGWRGTVELWFATTGDTAFSSASSGS